MISKEEMIKMINESEAKEYTVDPKITDASVVTIDQKKVDELAEAGKESTTELKPENKEVLEDVKVENKDEGKGESVLANPPVDKEPELEMKSEPAKIDSELVGGPKVENTPNTGSKEEKVTVKESEEEKSFFNNDDFISSATDYETGEVRTDDYRNGIVTKKNPEHMAKAADAIKNRTKTFKNRAKRFWNHMLDKLQDYKAKNVYYESVDFVSTMIAEAMEAEKLDEDYVEDPIWKKFTTKVLNLFGLSDGHPKNPEDLPDSDEFINLFALQNIAPEKCLPTTSKEDAKKAYLGWCHSIGEKPTGYVDGEKIVDEAVEENPAVILDNPAKEPESSVVVPEDVVEPSETNYDSMNIYDLNNGCIGIMTKLSDPSAFALDELQPSEDDINSEIKSIMNIGNNDVPAAMASDQEEAPESTEDAIKSILNLAGIDYKLDDADAEKDINELIEK